MRICLAKCCRDRSEALVENAESLALGFLAGSLRAGGHEVEVVNAALRKMPTGVLVERVAQGRYALVGFNLADPTLVEPTVEAIRALREQGCQSHICIGGHTATFHAEHILEMCPEINSVALFEGEDTICELAAAFQSGKPWQEVPGLAYRNTGSVVRSPQRHMTDELDRLPFPARDDLPYVLEHMPDTGAVPVLTSRGCHFKCGFCSVRAFYESDGTPTWRRRSIGNVLDEVEHLIATYGVKDILFVDDLFISRSRQSVRYAEDFATAVLSRGLDFTFTISATIDSVKRETFGLLRHAGLRQVYLGAESASPDILKFLGQWFQPQEIVNAVNILRELGLDASVSFINFTPATRMRHLRENVTFFKTLDTNILQGLLNRYQVYGGTPLHEQLKKAGALIGSFPDFDYRGEDAQVEQVHQICKQCLGPLLDLAGELKKAERISRRRSLAGDGAADRHHSVGRGAEWSAGDQRARDLLTRTRRGINEDAAAMFTEVLDFVEHSGDALHASDVERFVGKHADSVQRVCVGWVNTLRFIETFCASNGEQPEKLDSAPIPELASAPI